MRSNHISGRLPQRLATQDMKKDPDLSFNRLEEGPSHLVKGKIVVAELPTEEPLHYIPSINLDVVCGYKVA